MSVEPCKFSSVANLQQVSSNSASTRDHVCWMLNFQPSPFLFPTTTISSTSTVTSTTHFECSWQRHSTYAADVTLVASFSTLPFRLPSNGVNDDAPNAALCTPPQRPWVLSVTSHPRVLLSCHRCSRQSTWVIRPHLHDIGHGWRHPASSSTCVDAVSGAFAALRCSAHFGMSCACHLCWRLLTSSILNRREGGTTDAVTISLPCSVKWHALQYELPTPFLLFTTNHLDFQQEAR